MADPTQHPGALSGFGKIWEGVKHVGGKVLKWGAIAGIAALLVGMIPGVGAVAAWVAHLIPGVSSIASTLGIGGSLAGIAATGGALIGGLFGGVVGVGGVSDAVQTADAESVTNYDRNEARASRTAMLDQRRAEGQLAMMEKARGMGVAPGYSPGMEQGQGPGIA